MSTHNILLFYTLEKTILNYPHLPPDLATNFHGPKDVRAIEVQLYFGPKTFL